MNTLTYIFNVIRRFGLFGAVDAAGLIDELIEYQVVLMGNPEWRSHNIRILNGIDEVRAIRTKMDNYRNPLVEQILTGRGDVPPVEIDKAQLHDRLTHVSNFRKQMERSAAALTNAGKAAKKNCSCNSIDCGCQ